MIASNILRSHSTLKVLLSVLQNRADTRPVALALIRWRKAKSSICSPAARKVAADRIIDRPKRERPRLPAPLSVELSSPSTMAQKVQRRTERPRRRPKVDRLVQSHASPLKIRQATLNQESFMQDLKAGLAQNLRAIVSPALDASAPLGPAPLGLSYGLPWEKSGEIVDIMSGWRKRIALMQ